MGLVFYCPLKLNLVYTRFNAKSSLYLVFSRFLCFAQN
nr:MAG TPA: hypothetical protein [Caudoviricetes sp.]